MTTPTRKTDDTPKRGGDDARTDDAVHVLQLGLRIQRGLFIAHLAQDPDEHHSRRQHDDQRVHKIGGVIGSRIIGRDGGQDRNRAKRDQLDGIQHLILSFILCLCAQIAGAMRTATGFGRFFYSHTVS